MTETPRTHDSTQRAGWYPDAAGELRWWDGVQWHVGTAAAAGMEAPGAESPQKKRRFLVPVVVGVAAFGVGFAVGGAEPAVVGDVAAAEAERDEVAQQLADAEAELAHLQDQQQPEAEPAVDDEESLAQDETEPAPEPQPEPEPTATDGVLAFGDAFVYDNGDAVTVSAPAEFSPSEWSFGGEGFPRHLRFEITFTNGSDEPFDPSMFSVTASSAGIEADSVFDSEQGIEGAPTTSVLPGASVTFVYAFGVHDMDDLVLEGAPSWDHESFLYASER